MTIPVIDLGDRHAATQIARACENTGFLVVTNHGVDQSVIDTGWSAATRFFDLALADKMTVAMPYAGYPYGYAPMQGERLAASLGDATPPDLKETCSMGPIERPAQTSCRSRRGIRLRVDTVAIGTARVAAFPGGVLRGDVGSRRSNHDAVRPSLGAAGQLLRVTDRLPHERVAIAELPSVERVTEAWATACRRPHRLRHGDCSAADNAPGGLQVLVPSPEGDRWTAVPVVAESLIVNLGDAMARWTNDRWRSTLHRVVTPPASVAATSRRQSIAFFHNANWDAVIECIPSCLADGESPRLRQLPPAST